VTGVRPLLLGLVLLGTLGLLAELVLMEHFADWQQVIPLAVLGLGLAATALAGLRTRPGTVRIFQSLMVVFIVAGLAGLWLHYRGNELFELEIAPATSGSDLIWKALRGAVPTLAPGALVQLGLLGLIWSYDHPALRRAHEEERR
jgi:hypothetical protein